MVYPQLSHNSSNWYWFIWNRDHSNLITGHNSHNSNRVNNVNNSQAHMHELLQYTAINTSKLHLYTFLSQTISLKYSPARKTASTLGWWLYHQNRQMITEWRSEMIDCLCSAKTHNRDRHTGANPFTQWWTVTAIQNWTHSEMSSQHSSCLLKYVKPRWHFWELLTTHSAALTTCWNLSVMTLADPVSRLQQESTQLKTQAWTSIAAACV